MKNFTVTSVLLALSVFGGCSTANMHNDNSDKKDKPEKRLVYMA